MKRFGNALKLLVVVAVSLVVVFALAGCGSDSNSSSSGSNGSNSADNTSNGNNGQASKTYAQDKPLGKAGKVTVNSKKGFNADQQAVVNTIAEFADATQAKDYKKICQDLLSTAAQKLGGDCVATLSKTGGAIKNFKIEVKSVTVDKNGKTAAADATTVLNGKAGTPQAMNLVKDKKGDWRITILGQ